MSYFFIKVIAIITMLIDHIGFILLDNNIYCRLIGRISFPLFCFLLVNGYHHTSDKRKYLIRMLSFSFISEIFFDLSCFNKFDMSHQNVFFTLSFGLITIISTEKFKEYISKQLEYLKDSFIYKFILFLGTAWLVGFFMACNHTLCADYGWFGIILIYAIYLSYGIDFKHKLLMSLSIIIVNIINCIVDANYIELISISSIIFIFLFKDKKVIVPKPIKLFCYIFYPLHLFILLLLKSL